MKEYIWKFIATYIVKDRKRVERIVKKGGIWFLGAHLVVLKVGEPISEKEGARVLAIRGPALMQSAYGITDWVMPGDSFINDPDAKVCAIEVGQSAVLVI